MLISGVILPGCDVVPVFFLVFLVFLVPKTPGE
jgi:hypothetical protein